MAYLRGLITSIGGDGGERVRWQARRKRFMANTHTHMHHTGAAKRRAARKKKQAKCSTCSDKAERVEIIIIARDVSERDAAQSKANHPTT